MLKLKRPIDIPTITLYNEHKRRPNLHLHGNGNTVGIIFITCPLPLAILLNYFDPSFSVQPSSCHSLPRIVKLLRAPRLRVARYDGSCEE